MPDAPSPRPQRSSRLAYILFRRKGPRPESFISTSGGRNAFRAALTQGASGRTAPDGAASGESATSTPEAASRPRFDARKTRSWLVNYIPRLRPHRLALVTVAVLTLVTMAVTLAVPYACKLMIDSALGHKAVWLAEHLDTAFFVMIGAILLSELCSINRDLILRVVSHRITVGFRQRLYEHVQRLPLRKIHDLKTGGIISRVMNDVDATSNLLQGGVVSPLTNIVKVVATLAVLLLVIDWRLTVLAGLMVPLLAGLNLLWVRKIRPIHRDIGEDKAQISARVGEVFGGIRVVRSFRRERSESLQFGTRNHLVIRKSIFSQMWTQIVTVGWRVMIPLTTLIIAWYGSKAIADGDRRITVGDLIAFQVYMLNLLYPISQIVSDLSNLQSNIAALERTENLLNEAAEPEDQPGALPIRRIERGLELRSLSFAYTPGQPVLEDVNLVLPAGTSLALVGPSGAGKSTLADLVARFYEPVSGTILLDGLPLPRYRREDYKRLLAIVQQDTFLFDGTIAENIAYGRREADLHAIRRAAEQANCLEFIEGFAAGFDTYVGERGVRLSGGQKQRIAIARAILADPQLLILDEATSSLDSQSELAVQEGLRHLMQGRTSLVIAHRLSTVQFCTQIAVLRDGRIIESGTHEQLLASGGQYAEMLRLQIREAALA